MTPELSTTESQSETSTLNQKMFNGFPWIPSLLVYSLSWGWSLLRPSTLYWDDWAYIFNKPKSYLNEIFVETGLPPWRALIDKELLSMGYWTIRWLTFIMFFVAGMFLFEILKKVSIFSATQRRQIVLLFLIIPVNHARIALVMFGYTTSYFLFFLGWLILVRYKSVKSFVLAWLVLFLSLETHSLLFFVLLPFLHFVCLNKTQVANSRKLNTRHLQVSVIAAMPIIYLILRKFFWPPTIGFEDYHKPTSAGLLTGLWPILIGLFLGLIVEIRIRRKKFVHQGLIVFVVGFLVTALALFPYFAGELYVGYAGRPSFITVFEFRADWRSRHQLLMPLGLTLSVVGLNELFKLKKNKNVFAGFIIVVSVALNMFWGSQYFLQSHKQEKLVELFKSTKGNLVVASVGDSTLRFNGRENDFRNFEWDGLMTLAGIPTDRPGCEALPNGSVVVVKSDKPYLSALISRDLDLYFDVTPCSEVLAKDS